MPQQNDPARMLQIHLAENLYRRVEPRLSDYCRVCLEAYRELTEDATITSARVYLNREAPNSLIQVYQPRHDVTPEVFQQVVGAMYGALLSHMMPAPNPTLNLQTN